MAVLCCCRVPGWPAALLSGPLIVPDRGGVASDDLWQETAVPINGFSGSP